MQRIFFIGIILSISILSIGQTTYTFTGSGSWKVVSNWSNNTIPPSVLPEAQSLMLTVRLIVVF